VTRGKLASFVFIALACTAGAIFSLTDARPSTASPIGNTGTAALPTPIWSARRVPTVFSRAAERAAQARAGAALAQRLTEIVAPVDACVAVGNSLGSLARVGADHPLLPASTIKLLTAIAAVDRFGPDHRFTTRVFAQAGNLVVVGAGDPMLATPEYIAHRHAQARYRDAAYTPLTALADAITATGLREVTGALLVDDHLHDTVRYLPEWKAAYGQDGDVGSLGALSVDGGFSDPSGRSPAPDPALLTGRRLAAMLEARGLTIAGGVERGLASADAREIAHLDSPELSEIVGELLTSSDDYTAELLLRDLAVGTDPRTPATTQAGVRVVEQVLARLGVDAAGLVMHDGSGLARTDRATCATLLQIVEITNRPKFAAVDRGLAVAARSGTLVGRFVGNPLAGRLRGKTGSIDGVVGLAGVIEGPASLRFAFLANGDFSVEAGAQLQADVAIAVGDTPRLAVPADLVPAP
jgi:serine-type D-Ala-D-Ala carboxypeptidase/endopeptidase (penicillin-binding protein 4)